MFGLSKHHFFLALVMTPFLGYVGYALTDWYLQHDQPETQIKMMQPMDPGCRLSEALGCQFYAGDFTLTITPQGRALQIKGNQRLKALMIEVVGLFPPSQAKQQDEAGYVWQIQLPKIPSPEGLVLHWVAKGYWGNYLGEYPTSHVLNPASQITPSDRYGS